MLTGTFAVLHRVIMYFKIADTCFGHDLVLTSQVIPPDMRFLRLFLQSSR